ncbi:hypothetical protein ACMX2H_16020 [Arthrobacter sulfonylureivorans]|uniref:hypothetical protein n=1 Tax=Arthrobacter sulfonylureivorans TaxID=2486855 RepID=UPI0039E651AE
MSARDELARAIFMADNSNAPDPAAEWEFAPARHREYAFKIASTLIAAGYVLAPLEYAVTVGSETGIYVSRRHAEEALKKLQASHPDRQYRLVSRRFYTEAWQEVQS